MPLSEFELINRYFDHRAGQRRDVVLGIGDDGAILRVPAEMELVVSMDTLVAGIHFSKDFPPEDIGYKALAVNLSDLAAMGSSPAWATLALTIPAAEDDWLKSFARGFFELAQSFSVQLVGGDLSRGPLSITVQVHGFIPRGAALKRSGARPGDYLYVTGTLGDAACALAGMAPELGGEYRRYVLDRLHRPSPRVPQGILLRGIASSAIDISDGLVADLSHILEASGVGAVLTVDRLPLSPALRKIEDRERKWQLALTGGDDYELCFTVPPQRQVVLKSKLPEFGCKVSCIGRIEVETGLPCVQMNGTPFALQGSGYRHF